MIYKSLTKSQGGLKKLKIAVWNMRGFNSSIPHVRKLVSECDFIIITEHWLHSNRLDRIQEVGDNFFFCGKASKFSSADNYGTKRGQGGVAILWRKHLDGVSEMKDIIHDRICGIRIRSKGGPVVSLLAVYLPAAGCPEDFNTTMDDLLEIIETREDSLSCIIGGDFNADLGNCIGSRGVRPPTTRGTTLAQLIYTYNLIPCHRRIQGGGGRGGTAPPPPPPLVKKSWGLPPPPP